jgi:hypothetical protein
VVRCYDDKGKKYVETGLLEKKKKKKGSGGGA